MSIFIYLDEKFLFSTLRYQNNYSYEVNSSLTKITLIYENTEGVPKENVFTNPLNVSKINQVD